MNSSLLSKYWIDRLKPASKKILNEGIFILSPLIFSFLIFSLMRQLPVMPFVIILGSVFSIILIISILSNFNDKVIVVLRSVMIGSLYLFWLKNSLFSFEGMSADNRYLHMAIERFYYSFLPHSHEYANIHFSLPPLYFFFIGRIGALLKVGLPTLVKYLGFIFAIYLPYLWGYGLKGVFKEKSWFAAFIFSFLIPFKTYEYWYGALGTYTQKGWHFIGMFLIIIWYFWVRRKKPHFFKAGVTAGLIFAIDYYTVFLTIFVVLIEICQKITPGKQRLKNLLNHFLYYTKIGITAVAINLIWLIPVFIDLLTHDWGSSFNNWFHISGASFLNVFALMNPLDFISIVLIAGLINIFLNLSGHLEMDSLKNLFYAMMAFALAVYLLGLFKISFLFADYSLLILHIISFSSAMLFIKLGKKKVIPLIILLILNSTYVLNQIKQNQHLMKLGEQSSVIYKNGTKLRQMYNFKNETIFPYTNELLYGENTYSFISPMVTFSDISASYENRLQYARKLMLLKNKKNFQQLHSALKNSPYGRINYILLERRGKDKVFFRLKYFVNDMKYPNKTGSNRSINFFFSLDDFKERYFKKIFDNNKFVVFQLR